MIGLRPQHIREIYSRRVDWDVGRPRVAITFVEGRIIENNSKITYPGIITTLKSSDKRGYTSDFSIFYVLCNQLA